MIERYSREEMRSLFTLEAKFQAFLQVEKAATKAFCDEGLVPKEDKDKIIKNAKFDLKRIQELEKTLKHDVIAFTRSVSESLGEEKKWVHYGLTSTDVVDTANALIYKNANDLIAKDLKSFQAVLKEQALKHQDTPIIGRTHGIHADITSFGLKWALWYDELSRHIERFDRVRKEVEIGKISGAVGNFANVDPSIQDKICGYLGIGSAKISTQVLQRDRHAHYMSILALIGGTLEKIAVEIRHLQRTEVHEVEEFFSKGQKGSSAMPHKRNPIASENISGVARILRGYMVSAQENIALWHERDISHSSVERVIIPDALMLLDYALNRYQKTLSNLTVFKDQMMNNIYKTNGIIFSQQVLNLLIQKGLSREEAYDMVQNVAMDSYHTNQAFRDLLKKEEKIMRYVEQKEIDQCFDLAYYFKNVGEIYRRVGLVDTNEH
jgi:adenylosuccinate lyase